MPKTEIDLSALAAAISQTILNFATAKPNDAEENTGRPEIKKSKRSGKRITLKQARENALRVGEEAEELQRKDREQEEELISDGPEEFLQRNPEMTERVNPFLAPARREDFQPASNSDRNIGRRVPFKKKVRLNLFKDDLTVATAKLYTEGKGKKRRLNAKGKSLYPEPAERRDPDVEYEYRCDVCGRNFMAFASYIPRSVDGESQPQIKCQRCNCK